MRNLHKAYYKDYYSGIDFSDDDSKTGNADTENNRKIIASRNSILTQKGNLFVIPKNELANATIQMTVDYPGLITGTGITHEAKIQGEFKLGMHFDYTYGMPVIYGSTVKGVLRSHFKEEYDGPDADAVIADIFGSTDKDTSKSIYVRDIFFDAVVVEDYKTEEDIKKEETKGQLLVSDAITPHSDNPLKNPVPINFVKVAPGCTVEFRFRLVNSILKANQKAEIFKQILLNYGIGSKTNIGYGQFVG